MKYFCSIVQDYYPDDPRIRKQCELLASNSYQVCVIALRNKGQLKFEIVNGVEIHRVNLQKKRASRVRYFYEYAAFFTLAFLKLNLLSTKNKFHVIQTSNLPDFLVFVTILQKYRGTKIILDMHEIMPEFFISKYKIKNENLIVNMLKKIEKVSLSYADRVITINETAKGIFKQRSIPNKDVTIIMNTVDESIVSGARTKQFETFNLVYHGYLHEIYGLDIALCALKQFSECGKDFRFYIFGSGPEERNLEILINRYGLQQNVLLKGHIEYPQMMQCLKFMDVGILPIRKDIFTDLSFSNKLSEYIHLKIPVITSDLNSVKYYFSSDEITYFESGDPISLKKSIAFAYRNYSVMKSRAEKAFVNYQSMNWTIMQKRYLSLVRLI